MIRPSFGPGKSLMNSSQQAGDEATNAGDGIVGRGLNNIEALLSSLEGEAEGLAPSIRNAVGGGLASRVIDEVYSGKRAGNRQKEYLDAAYPGTNPWERLGGSGSGSSGGDLAANSQRAQFSHQTSLQNAELATRKQIAEIQASAHVRAAQVGYEDPAAHDLRLAQAGGARAAASVAPSQIDKNISEAILSRAKVLTEGANFDRARAAAVLEDAKISPALLEKEISDLIRSDPKVLSALAGYEVSKRAAPNASAFLLNTARASGIGDGSHETAFFQLFLAVGAAGLLATGSKLADIYGKVIKGKGQAFKTKEKQYDFAGKVHRDNYQSQ